MTRTDFVKKYYAFAKEAEKVTKVPTLLEKIFCLYKIKSPTNKVYIGITSNFKNRISKYKNNSCKSQPKLYRSLKKYGFDKHSIQILAHCTENKIDWLEKEAIRIYDSMNNGLNSTEGGRDANSHFSKYYEKHEFIPWNKGLDKNDERILKYANKIKGKSKPEHIAKQLRTRRLSIPHTEEVKEHLRKKSLKHADKFRKPIIMIDELGNTFEFVSLKAVSEYIKGDMSTISKVARGLEKSYRGYKFKYKNE